MILSLSLPVAAGSKHYRIMDKGTRIFFWFSALSLIVEVAAYYCAIRFKNNLPVYNVSNIVELALLLIYFNETVAPLRRRRIGILFAGFSLLVGVLNLLFVQSVFTVTSYFLDYQSLVVVIFCIISLSSFLRTGDQREPRHEVHFWLPVILMISCCLNYLMFTLIRYYEDTIKTVPTDIILTLLVVDIVNSLAIATVYFNYPKLKAYG